MVTGDDSSLRYWTAALGQVSHGARGARTGAVIAERGRKGNFLGALQAYERVRQREFSDDGAAAFDQMVMLVGSGTRLSPVTQSLRNMKAALILPSITPDGSALTVGEAAIRSSAPWVRVLQDGGFAGLVIRWGDEIIVPSSALLADPGQYSDVDVVRFGYKAMPNELLANQKEWLICDAAGVVRAELPRQSLVQLAGRLPRSGDALDVHVNMGSFAASHKLLDALVDAFFDQIAESNGTANWDPYLWMALHSDNQDEWEEECCVDAGARPRDFASLLANVPDFWSRAQRARARLESHTGRPFTAKVLDFGEPYWFDAGNHSSLRAGINDIFNAGDDGDTVRALLGLPQGLAMGESVVAGSRIAPGVTVRNSVIIGSYVAEPESSLEKAIVVNSRVGRVQVRPGGVVLESDCDYLDVDGPSGFAFRLSGTASVACDEIAAEVGLAPSTTRLSYFDPSRIVDDGLFTEKLGRNALSFEEAAIVADRVDPLEMLKRFSHDPRTGEPVVASSD